MLATMVEAAFRSFVLGTVVWTGLRILRVQSARTRKVTWLVVLLTALAMPVIMRLHALKVSPPRATQQVTQAVRAVPHRVGRLLAPDQPIAPPSGPVRPIDWRGAVIGGAMTIYATVAALLALRLLIGALLALRLWLRAQPVPAGWEMGMRVRLSAQIRMPVAVGSGVLLPAAAKGWDEKRLRTVIAHERCHVNEGDFYVQILAGLHSAFFWFSPLSWWLQRELADLSEALSDEAGLQQAEDRPSYAELLLEFARSADRHWAGVAMARSGNIGRRIERVLSEVDLGTAFTWKRALALAAILLPLVAVTAGLTLSTSSAEPVMAFQNAPVAPPAPAAPLPPAAPTSRAAAIAPLPPEPPTPPVPPEPVETNWSLVFGQLNRLVRHCGRWPSHHHERIQQRRGSAKALPKQDSWRLHLVYAQRKVLHNRRSRLCATGS